MKALSRLGRTAQPKRVAPLLTIAQLGYAHWFFGNLYDELSKK